MKKIYLLCLLFLTFSAMVFAESDAVGFWKIVNEKSGKPESIIAIYPYQGKYFGKIVATYGADGKIDETIDKPLTRAPGVKGNPFYAGLDIIYNLTPEQEGKRLVGGKIMDPDKGKVYNAKVWKENGQLIMRGEVLMFGQNQTWPPALDSDFPADFRKPDLSSLVPLIPQANSRK